MNALTGQQKPDRSLWLASVLFIGGLVLAFAFTAGFVVWQINAAQQTWCQTLDLLTAHPVAKPTNPAANPSRVTAYRLYNDFVTQRERIGCG